MLTSNFHNAYSAKQNDVLFFIFPSSFILQRCYIKLRLQYMMMCGISKKKSEFLGEIGNNLLLKERMDMAWLQKSRRSGLGNLASIVVGIV